MRTIVRKSRTSKLSKKSSKKPSKKSSKKSNKKPNKKVVKKPVSVKKLKKLAAKADQEAQVAQAAQAPSLELVPVNKPKKLSKKQFEEHMDKTNQRIMILKELLNQRFNLPMEEFQPKPKPKPKPKRLPKRQQQLQLQPHEHFGETRVSMLRDEDFNNTSLRDGQDGIVMFYAPWCPHCTNLIPTLNSLAEQIHSTNGDKFIGAVDCTKEDQIADRMGIQGYPTLKVYRRGVVHGDYNGSRDFNELLGFLSNLH